MKKLIVLTVILQLSILIIQVTGEFQFGDIISFQRGKKGTKVYKHFAVYVGEGTVEGLTDKPAGADIFHFTGEKKDQEQADCIYGTIKETIKHSVQPEKDNYEDGKPTKYPIGSHADFIDRINKLRGQCLGMYNLLKNNCEHMATFVRYGVDVSKQTDQMGVGLVRKHGNMEEVAYGDFETITFD
ncbi:phospholipase A and acyltransferase 1-like [Genypterus blacodes]|uniref:phospholipase A and acyltransferase 1-like n=1 Tax=Genypterus blacodes TaxID=154954 RepID=UPI003F758588